ncbi:hypothetical protein Pcinc_005709 [Petrolisthes cinctipes]|uniref:Uncharacterized protein n=1 Tax=Petrolisthes cinctipes TaxID=88211 RepID=A0AAE1GEF3_PETCI|nr:hypothetical protein Pcinc_005709 [Petrolisthes cinctipes]
MATPTDTTLFTHNMSLPHASTSPPHASIQPATIHIPYALPFNYDVHTWFLHLEVVWCRQTYTQHQKYQSIFRALPHEVFSSLSPLISTFSQDTLYDELKAAIISAKPPIATQPAPTGIQQAGGLLDGYICGWRC